MPRKLGYIEFGTFFHPCKQCGENVKVVPCRAREGVALFCNKTCFDAWQRRDRKPIACDHCGKDLGLIKPTNHKRYCSKICQRLGLSRDRQGHRNPRFRGGRLDIRKNIPHWDAISRSIRKRDGHRCRDCGRSNCRLLVHHIVPWQIGGDPIGAANLITVCMSCHRFRHEEIDRQIAA